ncbi:MAG: ComEC family competence protein [Alphaproteobacteria bacterium]|nr:MAG: ComEC family competence protein [Alphaproteobacteria bacterium]
MPGQNKIYDELLAEFRFDRTRWFLWYPVFLGGGIALYFACRWQPGIWWLALPLPFLGFRLWPAVRSHPLAAGLLTVCLLISLGFSASLVRTLVVAAPVLQKRAVVTVTATVLEKSMDYASGRLLLGTPAFQDAGRMPALDRIRISSRSDIATAMPGDIIRVRAVLLPPPAPAYPGGFDFQRQSYFQSIGAVGYAIGSIEKIGQEGGVLSVIKRLSALTRSRIANFVLAYSKERTAGFIIAILTGDKGAIEEGELEDMRSSGLAHLLAISGLHMGMIGGLIFYIMRFLLALFPYLALHYPIKKIAALVALLGLTGYLFVSGMNVSAVRAYIMISAVFLAVCFDRRALSFRTIAMAALLILLVLPESLLTPSFQMSFAAVFALIALYERAGPSLSRFARSGGMLRRFFAYLAGILLTSLVAGLATAPFSLYHFGQVASYSLIANLMAVPVMGLWIMPWAIVSFLAIPLGLSFSLILMGWGIDIILDTARETASWPGAAQYLGSFPVSILIGISLACLWFLIWRKKIRWLAVPVVLVLFGALAFQRAPDIIIAESGNLYAIRTREGSTYLSSDRAEKFEAERWRLVLGDTKEEVPPSGFTCDPDGCLYKREKLLIAFPETEAGAEMDCARADIVISRRPVRKSCRHPELVIDRFDLWRQGAWSLYLTDSSAKFETVNGLRGLRPWVPERYRERYFKNPG